MALFEAKNVTVRFGGNVAVQDVGIDVEEGRITGLIGPNGAGKTTLFNACCGLQPTVAGTIHMDGREISKLPAHKRARLGIARTFQRLELFSLLTVRENVLAGAEIRSRWSGEEGDLDEVTHGILERLRLTDLAEQRVDGLPTGRARLVEVGRALAANPRVLLLDEPSSGLNEGETEELAEVLRELAASGLAVLLVEHDMSLVMSTCEVIHVLDFGQIIAVGPPDEIQGNDAVQKAYLGSAEGRRERREESAPEPEPVPALEVRDIRAGYGDFDVLDGVSFEVPTGSVFALLGPNGAGKSTTLKVIAGLLTPTSGSVAVCGRRVTGADADALARAGICMVPEGKGIFPNLSVAENLRMATFTGTSLGDLEERAYSRFPRLADRRTQMAGTLSGGEQQMLSMARALATDPLLLILDELSMGLAPIIVQDLYEQVATIAADGLTILVVEQFAHEVLGVADTAAIMLHGRIRKIATPTEIADELAAAYLAAAD